jgi:muramoyltetrapeptide carboxypeptidase LdcA involved in peptidoglycan recycling
VPERYYVGKKQLKEAFGVEVVEMTNTMNDAARIYDHPEERARDLMTAFKDDSIHGIFSTI